MCARAFCVILCFTFIVAATGCLERSAYRRWRTESAETVAAFELLAQEKHWRFVVNGTQLLDPARKQFETLYTSEAYVYATSTVDDGRLALIEGYYEPKEPVGATLRTFLVVVDIENGTELVRAPLELELERALYFGPPVVLTDGDVVFADDRKVALYHLASMKKQTVLGERAGFDIRVIEESDQFYCVVREKTRYATDYELILVDKQGANQYPSVYPGVSNVLAVGRRLVVEKNGAIHLLDPADGRMEALTDGTLLTAAGDDAFLHTEPVLERLSAGLMIYRFPDGKSSPLPAVVHKGGMYWKLSQPVVSPDGEYALVGREYASFHHGHVVEYDFRLIELSTGRDMGSAFYSRYLGTHRIGSIDGWIE